MSGLAGITSPVPMWASRDSSVLTRTFSRAIEHRGGQTPTIATSDYAAVCHTSDGFVSDKLIALPSGLIIALAGRIDNREELKSTFNESPDISDTALCHLLYKKHGLDFANHLRGDYVLMINDPAEARTILVRDRFGICPLYIHKADDALYFASELSALLSAKPSLAEELNQKAICSYAAGVPQEDAASTIYRNIERLPPAHIAVHDPKGLRIIRYWTLTAAAAAYDDNTAEAYRTHLSTAIARRRRGAKRVGSFLSGGLDSSTITALLASQTDGSAPLPTGSIIFDGSAGPDERAYINDVINHLGDKITPFFHDCSAATPFDDIETTVRNHGRPPIALNQAVSKAINQPFAEHADIDLVFDGHGGDEVACYGDEYLLELAENGHWVSLWRESNRDSYMGLGGDDVPIFWSLFKSRAPGMRHARRLKHAILGAPRRKQAHDPTLYLPNHQREIWADATSTEDEDLMALPRTQRRHLQVLRGALQVAAFEELDIQNAHSPFKISFPFWDIDVVEFCLSQPGGKKWSNGLSRALQRNGAAGLLPDTVRYRRDKFDFSPYFQQGLRTPSSLQRMQHVFYDSGNNIENYICLQTFRSAFQLLKQNPTDITFYDAYTLWRATMLSAWLDHLNAQGGKPWLA